jgi:hypothetical protein
LGTDWLCPEIIAHEAQKVSDLLVAPTFNIGMAQHHLGFPGTISPDRRPLWPQSVTGYARLPIMALNTFIFERPRRQYRND